jgi:bacillithiol biosynthesis deacetylase BshB2
MEKHVVVIYPHPDDESFGAAGTIAKFRSEGVPVTYLCGTLGEMGRNMGAPTFANRETLPEIRKKELTDACRVLDMELRLLGYRDKTIEFEERRKVAGHLKGILEEIEPSLVITHYPGYAVHPDHNALGAAAIEAVGMMDEGRRPTVWAQAISSDYEEELGKTDITNDISNYFETKLAAIFSHKSQVDGMFSQFKETKNVQGDLKEALKERFVEEVFYIWDFSQ